MQLTFVFGYDLLIFTGCLVLHIQSQNPCGKEQYTVVRSDGSFYCLNCGTCIPGLGLHPPCGSALQEPLTGIECKVCPTGKFSDEYDSSPCHSCQQCAKHEIVAVPCTNKSDRSCNGTCENGFFYSKKDSTHSCQKCSYCCFDGKDEEVSECINQGWNASKQHCRPRPDKNCSPYPSLTSAPTDHASGSKASKSGGLPQTTIIVIGVIGAVIICTAVLVVIICLYRRKKQQGTNTSTVAPSYAQNGPTTEPTVQYNSGYTLSHTVTPSASHEGLPAERQDGVMNGTYLNLNTSTAYEQATQNASSFPGGSTCQLPGADEAAANLSAVKDNTSGGTHTSKPPLRGPTYNGPPTGKFFVGDTAADNLSAVDDNTSGETHGMKPPVLVPTDTEPPSGKLPVVDEGAGYSAAVKENASGRMLCLSRQSSKDSQKSGDSADAGSGRWKRSPSTSSFTETLKRRLSTKKDEPLVPNEEEDTDGMQGPITIIQEPSSQEAKEGSKVELVFKCKARGNSKIYYQWHKDDTELPGKTEPILVIKPVTLPDFGSYKCHASCKLKDSPSDVITSFAAELDVTPRDGTTFKFLNEINDPDTQDRIGALLTQNKHSLGGWRQVAYKYGMDQLHITSLEGDQEAGKKTLDFVNSSKTQLTVYNFCKTLKEHKIRRLDIVEELLEHLSKPSPPTVHV